MSGCEDLSWKIITDHHQLIKPLVNPPEEEGCDEHHHHGQREEREDCQDLSQGIIGLVLHVSQREYLPLLSLSVTVHCQYIYKLLYNTRKHLRSRSPSIKTEKNLPSQSLSSECYYDSFLITHSAVIELRLKPGLSCPDYQGVV